MIINNLQTVKRDLVKYMEKIDNGTRRARDEMMTALIQLSKEEIQGQRPEGQKATTGEPPMNRTGNLRRSITGYPAKVGFATYSATVGPQMIYSRAVELGGSYAPRTWVNGENFPYMAPALKKFHSSGIAQIALRKHLGGK